MTADQIAGVEACLLGLRSTLGTKRMSVPPSKDPDVWNEEGAQLLGIAERLLNEVKRLHKGASHG